MPKIVFIGGIWDLFHVGHLNILRRARSLGGILVVGVLTDEAAMAYKPKPIMAFGQRIRIVQSLSFVNYAIPQEDTDPTYMLEKVNPNVLVHGDDWKHVGGEEWMRDRGREVVFLPYTKGISTSATRKKIKNG